MLIYPPSMANEDHRPVVVFRNAVDSTKADTHIFLPIPQSIQFGDSASYNNTELGFGGSMVLNAARQGTVGDALTSVASQSAAAVPKNLKDFVGLLGSKFTSGAIQSAIGIATGTTMNKNIVTEFSGVGTRQFSFSFKLMSTSKQESDIIKGIIDAFRAGLYPTGSSLQLRYPPTWYINFKQSGRDIIYLPKIFETYLTSLNTTYNSSMNLFHTDGSPVETDINVSFTESRALTKADIDSLVLRAFQDGDFTRVFNADPDVKDALAAVATAATGAATASEGWVGAEATLPNR